MQSRNKVLISTAWWPTKTPHFARYAAGVVELLAVDEVDTEFFITTSFHESKFGSNATALHQAEEWLLGAEGFTHLLILDADVVLPAEGLCHMLEADKGVILAGRGHGSGISRVTRAAANHGQGWGCALISAETLEQVPLIEGFSGDFLSPDRMWFKKLEQLGIEVWCHHDTEAVLLEESASAPMAAFKP